MRKFFANNKGFTLIELLIVIAVLGVLAATLLVVVNPIEQLARGEDSGRKSSVAQLGRAVQAYYTANDSTYPAVSGTSAWNTRLTTTGEIKTFPTNPNGVTAPCTGGSVVNNYCYKTNGTEAVVYTRLESDNEQNKGTCAGNSNNTWYVWSSAAGKAGLYCSGIEPAPGVTGASLL